MIDNEKFREIRNLDSIFMNKNIIWGLGWTATIALAFAAGRYLSDGSNGSPRLVEGDSESPPSASSEEDSSTFPPPDSPPAVDSASSLPPPEPVPAETVRPLAKPPKDLVQALSSPDLVTRWGGFIDAVRTMNPGSVEQVVAAFETLPSGYERNMEMRLLIQGWARFDPAAAISYAKRLGGSESRLAITEAMTAWSENNPDAALAWVEDNVEPTEANRQGYLPGLINGIASSDLSRANELLLSIEDRNARWQASTLLVQRYLDQSPENAMTWAASLPGKDPNHKNGILGQVSSAVAKRDPQSCARWAESLEPSEGRNRVVSSLIAQWSRRNPAEAAKWAGDLEDVSTRVHGMTQAVNYWAFKDPSATAEWLDGYPRTAETDPVVQTFVNRVTNRDPASAADWANVIVDPGRRDASVRQVLKTWKRLNESSAEAWRVANAPHIPAGGEENQP